MKTIIMQDRQGREVDVTKSARRWRSAKRKADKLIDEWHATNSHSSAIKFTDAYAEQQTIERTIGDLLGPYKRREFVRLAERKPTDARD